MADPTRTKNLRRQDGLDQSNFRNIFLVNERKSKIELKSFIPSVITKKKAKSGRTQ